MEHQREPESIPHQAAKPRSRSRWVRRIGLAPLLIVAALVGAHWFWGYRAGRLLTQKVDGLRAAGEPVAVGDLDTPGLPDAVNAVADLRAAAASIDQADPDWLEAEKVDWTLGLPLTHQEAALVAATLADNAEALRLIRSATTKPGLDWSVRYRSPMVASMWSGGTDELGGQRNLANLLISAALDAHRNGDDAEALRGLEDVLFVAAAVDQLPIVICHTVAIGINASAARAVALAAPELQVQPESGGRDAAAATRGQVERLIASLLDERALETGRVRALRGERVMHLDSVEALADGRLDLFDETGVSGGAAAGGAPERVGHRVGRALRRYALKPLFLTDGRIMADYTGRVIEGGAAPDWPMYDAAVPDRPLGTEEKGQLLHPIAGVLGGALNQFARQQYYIYSTRRAAAAALAVRLYALDHRGRLPAKLADLIPDYLPAVPTDVLSGKPLGYVPDGEKPRLYHVGRNGVDDGGLELPPDAPWKDRERKGDEVFHLKRRPRPAAEYDDGAEGGPEDDAPAEDSSDGA